MASYKQMLQALRENLEIIQGQLQISNQDMGIIEQEKQTIIEMEKWSNIEEATLRQKIRQNWIELGISNSKYFHSKWNI
ncbi:hypothetical protein KY290_013416 [Solanum tuberosum]|uniref:Uncharacterized protein n=1 Tax=Solanum tuberosum TaxID=4113 RepID=A0ABQ7VLN7_SOLTU|nr:hypothetical protein KY285_012880 [Solanum tuberosum]KAH0769435.1 hypothetical protein KY290_013416 [Solanum tuberosum]